MIGLEKILLVEDNPKDLELALAALEESHLANEVAVARDGVEALEYLRRQGAFAARQDELPVVVLTSSREEPDLERCYELGVNAYIVKPMDFEQVIGVIKQIGIFWGILNVPPPSIRQGKT